VKYETDKSGAIFIIVNQTQPF